MTIKTAIFGLFFGLVWILGLGATCFAQEPSVRIFGTVRDKDQEEPLIGVVVHLENEAIGAVTDSEGHYEFMAPAAVDSIKFVVKYISYLQQEKTIVLSERPGKWEYELNFELEEFDPGWITPVPINAWPYRQGNTGEMDQMQTRELAAGGMYSTEQALNGVPGVRFDSRGQGGSRRLSIRGSVLRSPFGVQNIRAYMDEVPLTSPDGSTPIEVLDVANINDMAVEKGPQGDRYGPGSGGVLHIASNQDAVEGNTGGSANFLAGSNGYFRWMAGSGYKYNKNKVAVRYTGQQYAGYREQESNRKQMLFVSGQMRHKGRHQFTFTGWHYGGEWELPGALTAAQVEEDPRQAVQYSVDADARVNRQRTRLIGHYRYYGKRLEYNLSVYGNRAAKINPYGTSAFFQGYKDEIAWGGGGRSDLYCFLDVPGFPGMLTFGAEYQTESNRASEFDNDQGSPGPIRSDQQILARHALVYTGIRFSRRSGRDVSHSLELLAGLNQQLYRLTDDLKLNGIDLSAEPGFAPSFRPSLTYQMRRSELPPYIKFQGRLATGYSPPSIAELRRDDGSISSNVSPETTTSIEMQPAIFLFRRKLLAEVGLYSMQTRNAILPRQLITTEYVYQNAGKTRQNGMEAFIRYIPRELKSDFYYELQGTAAVQDYRFADYVKDTLNLTGNLVPGTPRLTLAASTLLRFRKRLEVHLTGRYNGRTWADDANTVSQAGYWLFNAQLSFHVLSGSNSTSADDKPPLLTVLAGMNNVLDQQYTNFLALNAFGGRNWNPAPGRNVFGGIQFRF